MLPGVEPGKFQESTSALKPFAIGVTVFFLAISANWLSRSFLSSRWEILGDFLLAAAAVLIVLWYERLRSRALLQRLSIVEEMNHRVCETLQGVICAASAQDNENLATTVRDAIGQIEWVLKQGLPEAKETHMGVTIFFVVLSANWLSRKVLANRWEILGDYILAAVAGAIVLWYERLRSRGLFQRLVIVEEVNRDVRNTLHGVICAASAQEDENLVALVRDSVRQIDWALKEVLPETKQPAA